MKRLRRSRAETMCHGPPEIKGGMVYMKRILLRSVLIVALCLSSVWMTSCGGGSKQTDYEHLREVSWEGTELTIKLGENQSTGCKWTTKPEDDSVIDYSVNRVFHLDAKTGKAIGTLEAGFKGKGAGTSRVICTTPVGWDGSGDGLVYIVTVTVKEDGTIETAKGEESDSAPAVETQEQKDGEEPITLESYYNEHPDELEEVKENINSDDSLKDLVTVDVTVKENTLSYIYEFKETYSDEQVESFKPDLKKNMEGEITDQMQEKIAQIEEAFGIEGVKFYMEYRNGDGSKIYGTTIE